MAVEVELKSSLLFTNCKLTISDKVSAKDGKLFKLITDQLQFKIIGFEPMVIEKDSPSQQDINNVFDGLKEFLVEQVDDFVGDVKEDQRKSNEHGTRENVVLMSSSIQTPLRSNPETDKQFTKHVREMESVDSCIDKLSSQQILPADDNINNLTNTFQHLQVNDVTQYQQPVKKSINQENLSCVEKISIVENISSRCESEQKPGFKTIYRIRQETEYAGNLLQPTFDAEWTPNLDLNPIIISSVHLLQEENDTNSFKKNSEATVSQMTYDSVESLQTERESNKTVAEVREQETECDFTSRKNSTGNSFSHSDILLQPYNKIMAMQVENAEKQEHVEEVAWIAQGQISRQESIIIAKTSYQESEYHLETDKDTEMDSNISCRNNNKDSSVQMMQIMNSVEKLLRKEQTANVNISSQNIEQGDEDFKQKESCSGQNVSGISPVVKVGQITQSEDDACKRCQCRNNTVKEKLTKQQDAKGLIVRDVEHNTEKMEEQTEDNVGRQAENKCIQMTEGYCQIENASTAESSVAKSKEDHKQLQADYNYKDSKEVLNGDHCIKAKSCSNDLKDMESFDPTLLEGNCSLTLDKNQKEKRKYDENSESASRSNDRSLEHRSMCDRNNQMTQESKKTQLIGSTQNSLESHNFEKCDDNNDKILEAEIMKHEESHDRNALSGLILKECDQFKDDHKNQMENINVINGEFSEENKLDEDIAYKQALDGNPRSNGDEKKSTVFEQTVQQNSSNQNTKEEVSSESDDESQEELIYSLSASSFKIAKFHFMVMEPKFSSYFEREEEGMLFTFQLNAHDEKDLEFFETIKQLRFEEYNVLHEDMSHMTQSVIPRIISELNGLNLHPVDRNVYIICSKDKVAAAKKMLHDQDMKPYIASKNIDRKDDTSKKSRITEENTLGMERKSTHNQELYGSENGESLSLLNPAARSPMSAYEHEGSTSSLHDTRPHDLKKSDYSMRQSGASGYNAYSKTQNDNLIVTDRSNLEVKIYKTNITKLHVDCIVNAANKRLQHFGGVAKVIAEAAGPSLTKECEDFIKNGNTVEVTNNFVSTGGKLPAKFVMHAVGPKWDSYDDKIKPLCLHDLRQTVLRCLVEASRRGMTSIALPSISAAIFKVPKEECAKCYMEAVKHFDIISHENKYSLREIHFVDIDDTMVNFIRECFSTRFVKPYDQQILQEDREFAKEHYHSASRNETSNQPKKSGQEKKFNDHNKSGPSAAPMGTSSGKSERKPEMSETYKIDNITLTIDIKPAFDHPGDTIITIGKPFDKLSGLHDYSVKYTTQQGKKNIFEIVSVSKPGSKASRLVLVVYPEPHDPDNIKDAFKNLEKAIDDVDQKMTRLILTSSVLFAEPTNKQHQNGKRSVDSKTVGKFSQCLFDYMKKSKTQKNISSVVVIGSEDAVPTIKKILESRNLVKIAPRAYPMSSQGVKRNTESRGERSRGESYEHQKHSSGQRSPTRPMSHSNFNSHGAGTSVDPQIACRICFGNKPCFSVPCCGSLICQDCEQRVASCPHCRKIWRQLIGDQPHGSMSVYMISDHCAGYESVPTWKITYYFPSGVQQQCHPNPGKPFNSVVRTAYIPAYNEGFHVLLHLRLAFIRKLTFTIGHSATSNREGTIVWNDIHHKTHLNGFQYGYPDPGYFQRVMGELASKGVFIENITEAEQYQIKNFIYNISTSKMFTDY